MWRSSAIRRSGKPRAFDFFWIRLAGWIVEFFVGPNVDGKVIVRMPSGRSFTIGTSQTPDPIPVLSLHNIRVIRSSLRRGALGFADTFIEKDISCSDLTGLIRFFLRNRGRFRVSTLKFFGAGSFDRVGHFLRRNSLTGSRRNVSQHYDLGNAFYRLWLDEEMNYSSGLYKSPHESLETAQAAKADKVRALLAAKPGASVLDLGCGWGAFARRTIGCDDVSVRGVTLSRQQVIFARRAAQRLGQHDVSSFELCDYRQVGGTYDHIVSIEMLEAVGERYWPQYFATLYDHLKPGGTAVIQSIVIDKSQFPAYRRRCDFVQRYIFPGGMLLTKEMIERQCEVARLHIAHEENFGLSYAYTLRDWRQRFEASWPKIKELGFDERFRRQWLYYLMYCEAGFLEGAVDVSLFKLQRVECHGGMTLHKRV